MFPDELLEKWQKDLEAIDSKLGGTKEKPISSLLVMLETPDEMVVLCTAGECACMCLTCIVYINKINGLIF